MPAAVVLAVRLGAAIALLAVGADHLYEYTVDSYSAIPTIGSLFLLNAIGGFSLGLILLIPARKLTRGRSGNRVTTAVAVGGIALAAGSLAALLISEATPLFGFMEVGYRTTIVVAVTAEAAAIVLLGVLLALIGRGRRGPATHGLAPGGANAVSN